MSTGNLQLKFPSSNVAGLPNPDGGALYGTRFSPGLKLELENFFAEFRVEGSFTNGQRSSLGINYFDTSPSSSLAEESPMSLWEHEARDENDLLRANFGIRSASLGFKFGNFQLRLGPHRYDITQAEKLCMEGIFSSQCKFAFLSVPLGYFGGELAYELKSKTDTLRRLYFSAGGMDTGFGGFLALFQGLGTFAFNNAEDAPALTLHAYGGWHSNEEEEGLSDPGITHAEGFVIQYDDNFDGGKWNAGVAYGHRAGRSMDLEGMEAAHTRDVMSFYAGVNPGKFLIRGMYSHASTTEGDAVNLSPPSAGKEFHSELSVGYQLVDGLSLSLGHRGVYGGEGDVHIGFLGLNTDLQHKFNLGE
jgi:hypothetical protein